MTYVAKYKIKFDAINTQKTLTKAYQNSLLLPKNMIVLIRYKHFPPFKFVKARFLFLTASSSYSKTLLIKHYIY